MEMHQIRYFLAVADTLNFTRAAERCHVTQPALSRAIQLLEEEIGGLLFRRDRGAVAVTDLGRLMRPYLEKILGETERARATARGFLTLEKAELKLGVLNTIGPLRFTAFLAKFHHGHPGIQMNVTEGAPAALIEAMEKGALDVAIMAQPVEYPERFDAAKLYDERFVVCFAPGHRFAKRDAIRPADMDGVEYLRRIHCEYRPFLADLFAKHGAAIRVVYQSQREDWIQSMIAAGLGVSSLPEFTPLLPGLESRPYAEPEVKRAVSLVTVSGRRFAPALSAFVKAVKAHDWRQ
jgi:LysR family transcriptional regulator, hydrogen peroxide-inducible genes activator